MKLSGARARAYPGRPDPAHAGVLIHGADAMRVALARERLVTALIGPEGADEMRLERLEAGTLRGDPAALGDAVRARGFFPGRRAVLVEGAGDALAGAVEAALAQWSEGDAHLIVTATGLRADSKLRKLFEGARNAVAIAIYDDAPEPAEVDEMLAAAGIRPEAPAREDVLALSAALDPGEFRQFVERLSLYGASEGGHVAAGDVAVLAPATGEVEIDALMDATAEGRTGEVGPLVRRLAGQGVGAVDLAIQMTRHFRVLHAGATDPAGPARAFARQRPPVFWKRRDRMAAQVRRLGTTRIEAALGQLLQTDRTLRSGGAAPGLALIERALVRIAVMAAK